MTVSLVLGYVEIRDKGIVQKKIKVKNRSFEDVAKEIDVFFKARGKRLAPGILEETLTRIGVPRARSILIDAPESESEPTTIKSRPRKASKKTPKPVVQKSEAKSKVTRSAPKEQAITPEEPSEVSKHISEPEESIVDDSTVVESTAVESESSIVRDEDSPSKVVDSESGSLVSVQETNGSKSPEVVPEKPVVAKVETGGATFVSRDESLDSGIKFLSGNDFSDILEALSIVESMSDDFVPPVDNGTTQKRPSPIKISLSGTEELRASSKTHAVDSDRMRAVEPAPILETQSTPTKKQGESATAEIKETTPDKDHIIKPIITAKGIVLGEDGVGKKSLLSKAKMGHPKVNGIEQGHIYENIYELSSHRVHLQSWCFDDAAKANVSRRQFYDGTGVAIIVYSVVDRWSFDSVDFWVKEVTNSLGYTPPIVLVGNKVDLRKASDASSDRPISQDEGYKLAEAIANKFGEGDSLHPIGFVETSCLTGQGVDSVFVTAAKLWIMSQSN